LVEFINQSTNSSKIRRNLCTPSPSKSVTKVPVCFRFNLINYVCYTCEFDCTGGILSLYSLFLLNFISFVTFNVSGKQHVYRYHAGMGPDTLLVNWFSVNWSFYHRTFDQLIENS